MSTHHTTFVVYGAMLSKSHFLDEGDEYHLERLDRFEPPTRGKLFTPQQVAVIVDSMSGSYYIGGFIYHQSDRNEALGEVIRIADFPHDQVEYLGSTLQSTLRLKQRPKMEWLIVPHYY